MGLWTTPVISRSGLCFVSVGFVYGVFRLSVTAFFMRLHLFSRVVSDSDDHPAPMRHHYIGSVVTEPLGPAVISRNGLCFVRAGFVYGAFESGVTLVIGSLLGLYVYDVKDRVVSTSIHLHILTRG